MKKLLFNLILFIALQECSLAYAVSSEEAADLALKAANAAIAENVQALFGVGACVKLVATTYTISKGLKSYLIPSEEEHAEMREIDNKLKLLELRKMLKGCLVINRKTQTKSSLGIPSACEEFAVLLGLLGGQEEANRMIAVYRAFNE